MRINLEGKSTKQLVEEFISSSHTTEGDNRYSATIHAKAAEEIVSAMQVSAESSEKLNLWLMRWTALIAIATVINILVTLVCLY
jgi:hypothetical protein